MGRKSAHNLPPGIQFDKNGVYWATLEGEDARRWRDRYPGRSLPRRKAETLKDARALQRKLMRDLEQGRNPNAENPKVADWVKQWIEGKQRIAPSTVKRYRTSLKHQIEGHRIGRLRLSQLNHYAVRDWVEELKAKPHDRYPDRTLDPYTIRNAFALLRAALNTAVDHDQLAKNPCRGVELPRPDDDEIRPLTTSEVRQLLALLDTFEENRHTGECRPHRNAALYHVALRCGLRQAELFGLRWVDVDFDRKTLTVAGQWQDGARTRTKTKRSTRTVPLSPATLKALAWHKRNQEEEKRIAPPSWNSSGLVFCTENGTALDKSNSNQQLSRFLKKAGLPRIRFHDMRHTYAALSIYSRVDIYTLSRWMGHCSISVTADRYGHLYEGQSDYVIALDDAIEQGV